MVIINLCINFTGREGGEGGIPEMWPLRTIPMCANIREQDSMWMRIVKYYKDDCKLLQRNVL